MKSIFKLSLVLVVGATVILAGCQKKETGQEETSPIKKLTEKVTGKEAKEADPYADWVVFDKPNHKFSLKHPQEWLYVPEIDKEGLLTGTLEQEDLSQEDFVDEITGEPFTVVYVINMRVEDNPENKSAKEHELSKYLAQSRAKIEPTLKEVTMAGIPGIKIADDIKQVNTSGGVTQYKLAPGNGKVYAFWYVASAHPETHEKYLSEFEEILSTLKFDD